MHSSIFDDSTKNGIGGIACAPFNCLFHQPTLDESVTTLRFYQAIFPCHHLVVAKAVDDAKTIICPSLHPWLPGKFQVYFSAVFIQF